MAFVLKEISYNKTCFIILILSCLQLFGIFAADFSLNGPFTGDDVFAYQIFVEDIFKGKLNFTYAGFQGSSLPAILLHAFFPTPQSYTLTNLFFAIIAIPLMFLVTQKLFHSLLSALLASLFYALMPSIIFSGFWGFPQGVFHFLTLLTLLLILRRSKFTFLFFAWSLIAKPFSFALLPFFIQKKQLKHFFGGCLIGMLYLYIQYLSMGRIIIGIHPDITPGNVFQFNRLLYNLASAPPLLFSIHNYLAFSETTVADMLHTSPLIIIFALITVLHLRNHVKEKSLFYNLVSFWLISFFMAAILAYVDTVYLQTFLIASVWLALPFFKKFPLLIPITVATTAYQYFFLLIYRANIWTTKANLLYIIPIVCMIFSLYLIWPILKKWCGQFIKDIYKCYLKPS